MLAFYFRIHRNGVVASSGCNHIFSNETLYVFNGEGKRQICASLDGRTENLVAVQFHLSMGSGECHFLGGSNARIEVIVSAHSRREIISALLPEFYKVVIVTIHITVFFTVVPLLSSKV